MAIAGALALAFWSSDALDFRSTAWTHPNLVETRDSPYGRVTVEQLGGQVSVFENDALSFNTEGTEAEEFVQLAALQHPAPESVLVLGGGIEGIVREILPHRPRRVVDVELNPVLARVVLPRLPAGFREAARDPSVEVRLEDPREYLRGVGPPFDLILVGMPEPSSGQANRFYTREFFSRCRARMAPEGVLALRLVSSENFWTPQIAQRTASIDGALRAVFRDVVVIPGSTNVLVASMATLCRDPEVLASRLAERGLSPRLVSPAYLRYVFTNDRFGAVAGILEKSSAPVNSDARPICYHYTAMIWLSKFFPRVAAARPLELPAWWPAALWCAGALVLAGLLAASRRAPARRLLLVGSAGLAGTVLETVLILRYQVTSGVLYQNLGILLMSFMAGLGAGAAAVDAPALRAFGRVRLRPAWGPLLSLAALLLPALVGWQIHAGVGGRARRDRRAACGLRVSRGRFLRKGEPGERRPGRAGGTALRRGPRRWMPRQPGGQCDHDPRARPGPDRPLADPSRHPDGVVERLSVGRVGPPRPVISLNRWISHGSPGCSSSGWGRACSRPVRQGGPRRAAREAAPAFPHKQRWQRLHSVSLWLMPILLAKELRKTYTVGAAAVEAVRGVDLAVDPGDFVAVMGPSGCGKSTLLHLCGAMDRPTSGRLEIDGMPVAGLDEQALTVLRRRRIGFVFQFFNLLPTLTVGENIALPLLLAGTSTSRADGRAARVAERVGLDHRLRHFPQQLSGGEMQRAAIARAIVHEPALVVADEPTGNLDSDNGARVLDLLVRLNAETGVTVLLATHAPEIAAAAHRIVRMKDGRIESVEEARALPAGRRTTPVAPV